MDSALSGAPFFPEDFTLPQLPFFSEDRVDDLPLPATPSSICEKCWQGHFSRHLGLFWLWPREGPRQIKYWTSPARLKSGAEAGCVWCRFILHLPDEQQFDINEELMITLRGNPAKTWDEDSDVSQRYRRIDVDINEHTVFRGFVYTYLGDPAASYIQVRNTLDPASPRVMALARERIEACVRRHHRCQTMSLALPGPRLPTRLVDCTDLAHPRLVTIPSTKHGEYLALSYVWGEDQVHKTTTSNESAYKRGIALSLLPPTIRDAIRVTHMLGFQWLWVDSLCILQDSDEDKMHELSHMHRIYRGAHVTIVAASAERVSEGFLQKGPPQDDGLALPFICPPQPLTSQAEYLDDRSVGQSQVGQVYCSPRRSEERTYRSLFGCMATRAWCMQEYLLSPRCLIFSPQELLLRCCTFTQPIGSSPRGPICDNIQLPDTLFLPVPPAADPNSEEWERVHRAWGRIVENYSGRTAKEESDKLVACAAVAEHFHRVLRSDYLAGLWRSDTLLIDLLWSAERCTRATTYRAPSWSWAALEGSIKWGFLTCSQHPGSHVVMLAKVVQCWVTLEDPGLPFSRVTGGALVLYGVPILCYGELAEKDQYCSRWLVPLPSYKQRYQWSRDNLTSELEGEGEMHATNPVNIAHVTMDCDVDELPRRIWIVPFVRYEWVRGEERVHGIVLELARPEVISEFSHEKAPYRRIGNFWTKWPSKSEPIRTEGWPTDNPWGPLALARKNGEQFWEGPSQKCIEIV